MPPVQLRKLVMTCGVVFPKFLNRVHGACVEGALAWHLALLSVWVWHLHTTIHTKFAIEMLNLKSCKQVADNEAGFKRNVIKDKVFLEVSIMQFSR